MAGVVASKVRKQRAAAATALTNKEEKDTEDEEIRRQKQVRSSLINSKCFIKQSNKV